MSAFVSECVVVLNIYTRTMTISKSHSDVDLFILIWTFPVGTPVFYELFFRTSSQPAHSDDTVFLCACAAVRAGGGGMC